MVNKKNLLIAARHTKIVKRSYFPLKIAHSGSSYFFEIVFPFDGDLSQFYAFCPPIMYPVAVLNPHVSFEGAGK